MAEFLGESRFIRLQKDADGMNLSEKGDLPACLDRAHFNCLMTSTVL